MIKGSIVALVTPMLDNREVDWTALDKLIDFHLQQGTDGIVAVGTSGESTTLSVTEHCAVIGRVVERVAGIIPVIAGTGANATSEAIELTAAAKRVGVDACLLVTPYYNKPTQEGLYLHYKAIAEAVDIPQILYNVPGRTACDLLPETVLRLTAIDNIVGIKEATGDLVRAKQLIDTVPNDFAVYSGDDETAVELILLGGHGNISVTANIAPRKMADMCRFALEGDTNAAREIQKSLLSLHKGLFVESNPIPVKWALAEMGYIGYGIRLPLTVLEQSKRQQVGQLLRDAGLVT